MRTLQAIEEASVLPIDGVGSKSSHEDGVGVDDPQKVSGVRAIWVCSSHRRRGVATSLLDCAKSRIFTQSRQQIEFAFSQPTSDGLKFAQSYTGSGVLRLYSLCS